ncbi:TetR family transcriptional regulator [Actinomadura rupiterrae]|uniref:TetR family transcriptional regulator n=1 Tax=Actinomadura rupiterrae TaxID=559627 RepID=UPI0020A29117|nr:TetR family transcriptional regulator [Actinomadura rupiterrae]MCP2335978.1 AcrR family transcriptional regulator [Actinomadura rupiterrae]
MSYDADATRRRIFEAAADEFAACGLAGARVERIAAAAKANKQAIYLYFGNKQALFGAVLRAKMDEVCHEGVLDPNAVAETVGALFDWYAENPELMRLLLWEALETCGSEVSGADERRGHYRGHVDSLVQAGVGAGLPDPADRTRAAQNWLFTLLGLVAWNFAVPHLRDMVLDETDPKAALARRREAVVEAVRTLAAARPHTPSACTPAPQPSAPSPRTADTSST